LLVYKDYIHITLTNKTFVRMEVYKGKVFHVFNKVPCHEDVLVEWRYQALAALPPRKELLVPTE
jgi:hypothetical protein